LQPTTQPATVISDGMEEDGLISEEITKLVVSRLVSLLAPVEILLHVNPVQRMVTVTETGDKIAEEQGITSIMDVSITMNVFLKDILIITQATQPMDHTPVTVVYITVIVIVCWKDTQEHV